MLVKSSKEIKILFGKPLKIYFVKGWLIDLIKSILARGAYLIFIKYLKRDWII